jgi:hypothetical protein
MALQWKLQQRAVIQHVSFRNLDFSASQNRQQLPSSSSTNSVVEASQAMANVDRANYVKFKADAYDDSPQYVAISHHRMTVTLELPSGKSGTVRL